MGRNFGIGTRDMISAGRQWAAKSGLSYSSVATLGQRWSDFVVFAKSHGVGSMEKVSRELVGAYAKNIMDRGLSAATVQNRISAINSVMKAATSCRWESISPRSLGAPQRSFVRTESPQGLDRALVTEAQKGLDPRAAAILGLARELGLRAREASLIDAKGALREAISKGEIRITEGTKGGRARIVPILDHRQVEALKAAAAVQGKDGSMVPTGTSLKAFRGTLDTAREAIKEVTGQGLHALRAAYAVDRYKSLTGADAPVVAGRRLVDKATDHAAREIIARELGHGRTEVTASYLGSAR